MTVKLQIRLCGITNVITIYPEVDINIYIQFYCNPYKRKFFLNTCLLKEDFTNKDHATVQFKVVFLKSTEDLKCISESRVRRMKMEGTKTK